MPVGNDPLMRLQMQHYDRTSARDENTSLSFLGSRKSHTIFYCEIHSNDAPVIYPLTYHIHTSARPQNAGHVFTCQEKSGKGQKSIGL